MKLLALALLLILTGCASPDPYAQIAAAQSRIQITQHAQNEARKAAVEQERQEKAAIMATAGAAQVEIDLLNARSIATVQAIEAEQSAIDTALLAGQSTRAAWEYGLAATETIQSLRATQTVYPLQATTAYTEHKSAQDRALAWSTTLPILLFLLALIILSCGAVLIYWLLGRALINLERKRMDVIIAERQNASLALRNGASVLFLPGEIIRQDDGQRVYQDLNALEAAEPVEQAPRTISRDPDEMRAIRLLADSENVNGKDSEVIPGWRNLPGWTSERWQASVSWLRDRDLARTDPTGTYLTDGNLSTLRWQIMTGAVGSETE